MHYLLNHERNVILTQTAPHSNMPTVHSQELSIIVAPVRTGVGLIATYKEAWQVVLSGRYRVRLYMAVDDPSLTLYVCMYMTENN